MATVNHKCPVAGCRRLRKQQQVMCGPHWYQVPSGLRTRIWNLYGSAEARGGNEHLAAIREAIQCVNDQQLQTHGGKNR